MNNEEIKKMVNHYWNITKSIYLSIDKHTIQIFYDTGNGIEPFGTAILAQYKNHHFIISAAHVLELDEISNLYFEVNISVGGETEFRKIGKYILLTSQKISGNRANDKLDIAVMKLLGSEDIKSLKINFEFYNFEESDREHIPLQNIPYYIVYGYPGTYTKLNKYNKKNERKVFAFNSRIKEFHKCEKYGYEPNMNIFIDYPKRLEREHSSQLVKPPNPRGISGCGLWCITDSVNIKSKKWHYKLVGIMIEVYGERILVGTNLKHIDAIIKFINNEKSV